MASRLTPPPLWDEMLRHAPCHLLLFDATLVCRYAAPHGDRLLGRRRDELINRHAAEILPPQFGLLPLLTSAVKVNCDLRAEFSAPEDELSERDKGWRICVKSVSADQSRMILVLIFDICDLLSELREVRAERDALRAAEAERRETTRELYTDIRTLLTPIQGYLQLMSRRPESLAERDPADLIEGEILPAIHRLTELIERLPDETATRTPYPLPEPRQATAHRIEQRYPQPMIQVAHRPTRDR